MSTCSFNYPLAHCLVEVFASERNFCSTMMVECSVGGVCEQRCFGEQISGVQERICAGESMQVHMYPYVEA